MTVGNYPPYEVIWPSKNASGFNIHYIAKKSTEIEDYIKRILKLSNLWAYF